MTVQTVQLITKIIKAVCDEFDIQANDLEKNQKINRNASKEAVLVSYARSVAMLLLSAHLKQQTVANLLNCNNHSTVCVAIRRAKLLAEVNPMIKEKLKNINKQLYEKH